LIVLHGHPNAWCANAETISSHAEHKRKRFQKSCVIGPWDHKELFSSKKIFKIFSCLCTFKIPYPSILESFVVGVSDPQHCP
jgi:hypothetical protein